MLDTFGRIASVNVTPTTTLQHSLDCSWRNAVSDCYHPLTPASGRQHTGLANIFGGESGIDALLPARNSFWMQTWPILIATGGTSLGLHVSHVFLLCSKKQVCRINAQRNIAPVKSTEESSVYSIMQFVHDSGGEVVRSSMPETCDPVALVADSTGPQETARIRFWNYTRVESNFLNIGEFWNWPKLRSIWHAISTKVVCYWPREISGFAGPYQFYHA